MPLIPRGLGRSTLERIKKRIEEEVGSRVDRFKDRIRDELGGLAKEPTMPAMVDTEALLPENQPSAHDAGEILVRLRMAVNQEPPKMVRGYYQAADADAPSWRYLQPYCMRRGRVKADPNALMLFAACEADGWKIEGFRLDRFHDLQNTNLPYVAKHPYPVEVHTF